MQMKWSRKVSAYLLIALGVFVVLMQLGEPHFGMYAPVDGAAISSNIFHVIVYAACLGLIFIGIRKLISQAIVPKD